MWMKKILLIIIVLLLVINISVSIIIFTQIESLQTPHILVTIDAQEFNQDELLLTTTMHVKNPNSFVMTLENLSVISKTHDGIIISQINLKGGSIDAKSNKTYNATNTIAFQDEDFLDDIENQIRGQVGFTILGIYSKKMPLNITIIGNVHDIIADITIPDISITLDFDRLHETGIYCNGSLDIYNENNFALSFSNLSVTLSHETVEDVGNITIASEIAISPGFTTIPISGTILYEALNPGNIIATIKGTGSALAAGLNISREFTTKATLVIPDLESFLYQNQQLDISSLVDFDILPIGINVEVGLEIYNPTKIRCTADDLICGIYRVDNSSKRLLVSKPMDSFVSLPEQKTNVISNLIITYPSLLPQMGEEILPNWLLITISGNFSIADTNQQIPVAINGFISPRFLAIND